MNQPRVLVCYYHRPMCVGLFYRRAFEQAGCEVRSAGPSENQVYGHSDWHDYRPPDIELPQGQKETDVAALIDEVAAKCDGWRPDMVAMIDQYDFFYLIGKAPAGVKYVHLAVENWNDLQYQRSHLRQADAEYYMICHDSNGTMPAPPFAVGAEWQVFGADPDIHPYTRPMLQRQKWVCQIGSPYEPRPTVWNFLRKKLDDADGAFSSDQYGKGLIESERTSFGRVFNYAGMADAYNDAVCALSCSNVDFIPMRAAEAFAMGNVLISDDVPSMRAAFGAPWPESPSGIWASYDRSHEALLELVTHFASGDRADAVALTARARAAVDQRWRYRHNAENMLRRVRLR